MKPKVFQFSLVWVLLVVSGISAVAAMGAAGGRHWFTLGVVLLAGAIVLWFGFRWAIYGAGYWPTGLRGLFMYLAALVLLPLLVLLLGGLLANGIGNQRTWWWPP